jgi:hypothetical protein
LGLSHPYPDGYGELNVGLAPGQLGLPCSQHARYFPRIYSWQERVVRAVDDTHLVRGWWILLVLVGAGAALGLRRSLTARLLTIAGAVSVASFMVGGAVPGYRYIWPTAVFAAILACAAVIRLIPSARVDRTDEEDTRADPPTRGPADQRRSAQADDAGPSDEAAMQRLPAG